MSPARRPVAPGRRAVRQFERDRPAPPSHAHNPALTGSSFCARHGSAALRSAAWWGNRHAASRCGAGARAPVDRRDPVAPLELLRRVRLYDDPNAQHGISEDRNAGRGSRSRPGLDRRHADVRADSAGASACGSPCSAPSSCSSAAAGRCGRSALSLLGAVLSLGYQLLLAPPMPGATESPMMKVMPIVIIVIAIALFSTPERWRRRACSASGTGPWARRTSALLLLRDCRSRATNHARGQRVALAPLSIIATMAHGLGRTDREGERWPWFANISATRSRALRSVAIAAVSTPASAQQIDRIVAFGDSYADTGNAFALGYANPQALAIYPTGRFSGGTNYIDTLAALLHVPVREFRHRRRVRRHQQRHLVLRSVSTRRERPAVRQGPAI